MLRVNPGSRPLRAPIHTGHRPPGPPQTVRKTAVPLNVDTPLHHPKLSKRDKIGLFVLFVLIVLLCFAFIAVFRKPPGNARGPADSIFVKQRIINLQKSKE